MSVIGRRVVIASAVLLVLVGAAFAALIYSIVDLQRSERRVQHSQQVLAAANEFERLVVDLETGQRGFIITARPQFLEPWFEARAALPAQARTLEELVVDDPLQLSRVQRISAEATAYITEYSVPLIAQARRDPASARTVAATAEGKQRVDNMRSGFDSLTATEQSLSATRREQSGAVARRAVTAAAIGLVGSVVLILGFAHYLTRAIVRPVLGTAAVAERLAGGDLSVRVPETAIGEIRTLERAFNTMAATLGKAQEALAASRARLVRSADETRRQIERDLHDGIQQRLVSLALNLRAAEASTSADPVHLRLEIERVAQGLEGALGELREISRGIHPAILSDGGLSPAVRMLARRAAVPVEVDLQIESRLPAPIEVAAYYVVSEALTNAVKHARASVAYVTVHPRDGRLHLSVRDDGRGGADFGNGSGLIGLKDRVEALGGRIFLQSEPGAGTELSVSLPISGAAIGTDSG